MIKISSKYFKTKYLPSGVLEHYSFPSKIVKPKDSFNDQVRNLLKYSLTIKKELNAFEKKKENFDNVRNYIDNKGQINPKLKIKRNSNLKEEYNLEIKEKDEEDYFSDIGSIKELVDLDNIGERQARKTNMKEQYQTLQVNMKSIKENRKNTIQTSENNSNNKKRTIHSGEFMFHIKKKNTNDGLIRKYNDTNILEAKIRKTIQGKFGYSCSYNNTETKKDSFNTTGKIKRKQYMFPMINNPNKDNKTKVNPDLNFSKDNKATPTTLHKQKTREISLRDLMFQDNEL